MATILDPAEKASDQSAEAQAEGSNSSEGRIRVKIAAPYNTYYDDWADSVSAENETGPFDVLKGHHSFMSLLIPGEVVVKDPQGDHPFKIARGIMHVHADTVKVFLDV